MKQHGGADDVGGHQVGGELDPREVESDGLGEGSDQQGLAQTRHALEQAVASREQTRDRADDDAVLTHDDVLDLPSQDIEVALQRFELGFGIGSGDCSHVRSRSV